MNEPTHYYEWDYPNDTVVQYARSGECCECGACCMRLIRFKTFNTGIGQTNPIAGWDSHNGEFINPGNGLVNDIVVNGKHRYFWDGEVTDEIMRCEMLTSDNRCMKHIGKHLLSRAWPFSPRQVTPFSECTYTFTEVGRWKISELAEASNGL